MAELRVNLGAETTSLRIESGVLSRIADLVIQCAPAASGLTCVVVSDGNVAQRYGPIVETSLRTAGLDVILFAIPPGDESKSWAVAGELYRFLAEHAVGRDATIVALGGGMVSDLAGFVAATWMRGVRLVICPTTLEAMIDACLGGKTAINIPGAKNLVGAFHPAALVAIDPTCLKTLSPRDLRAGLAESVKHALIASREFFEWHEAHAAAIEALEEATIAELIVRNLQIKAAIVEQDPFERTGKRVLLNFGHTLGHAIEAASDYTLRHGECVALGMTGACRISHRLGLLNQAVTKRVEELLSRLGLPIRLPSPIPLDRIMQAIRLDKKTEGRTTRFVLLEDITRPTIRDDVPGAAIREACESLQAES